MMVVAFHGLVISVRDNFHSQIFYIRRKRPCEITPGDQRLGALTEIFPAGAWR